MHIQFPDNMKEHSYTAQEIFWTTLFLTRAFFLKLLVSCLCIGGAICLFYLSEHSFLPLSFVGTIAAALGIGYIFVAILICVLTHFKAKKSKLLRFQYYYTITNDTFFTYSHNFASKMMLTYFTAWKESSIMFLLNDGTNRFLMLPKHLFSDEEQQQIRLSLQQSIGNCSKKP